MNATLEQKLDYHFQDPGLLHLAVTHRSFSAKNNERLEFIGDSILNYAVAKLLYLKFPHLPEGDLSRMRANLVNQDTLSEIAEELELGRYLRLGPGEIKAKGFRLPSILSDAMEAIFAAITLDSDISRAERVITRFYASRLEHVNPDTIKDPKSRLQEVLQSRKIALPQYKIIEETGEDHQKTFKIHCVIPELNITTEAWATSRRKAEQKAALLALSQYQEGQKSHD